MGDILGYAFSTGDQDCTGQRLRLEAAGALRVFEDMRSGRSSERPGLRELLASARPGDTLAVARLDRLGHSLAELLGAVDLLKSRRVALLSLEEGIDSGSIGGDLVFHMFSVIAHFEHRAARAKGKRPGRPRLDRDKAASALELVQAGLSPTAAARQVGLGRATVYREMARAGVRRPV